MDTEIEGRFGILEPIRWPFRYSRADSVAVSVFSGRFGGRFGFLWPIRWPFRYSRSDSVFLHTTGHGHQNN